MHIIEIYKILKSKYLVAPLPRVLPDSLDSVVPLEMKEPSTRIDNMIASWAGRPRT